MLNYFSSKNDLFGINKELQFRVCNHVETCDNSLNSKERKILYRGEKEVGRAIEMKCPLEAVTVWSLLAFYLTDLIISTGWALKGTEEEDFLLLVWLCYCHRTIELLLTSWLYFNWGFCLLIFAPSFTHLHPQASQILKHKTQCYRISCFSRTFWSQL